MSESVTISIARRQIENEIAQCDHRLRMTVAGTDEYVTIMNYRVALLMRYAALTATPIAAALSEDEGKGPANAGD